MNGVSTSTGASLANSALGSTLSPIKNPRRVSITKLDSGFLIEKQNIDSYGQVNDVAIDLDGAMKVANEYFAD